jgi:nucleoside-diphosphate-sugar epimerase
MEEPGASDSLTVLITGAAGKLGSLLARHLLPTGHELRLKEGLLTLENLNDRRHR